MNRYRLYGMSVITDLEFPQLVEENNQNIAGQQGDVPEIEIMCGEIPQSVKERTDVKCEFGASFSWLTNCTMWMVVENGRKITYQKKEGGKMQDLRTYLLGWGMSMLALQRGILAVHCSAVAAEKGAVLICGESGAGKSTLTAAFLDKGCRFMADDMAFVTCTSEGKAVVSPAFPYQKLCRDAAIAKGFRPEEMIYIDEDKDKFLVPYRGEFSLEQVPVRGMLMLGVIPGEEVVVEEVKGISSFHLVANNLFLRHLLGARKYKPEIGQLCLNVAAAVPAAYLGRPKEGDSTTAVVQKAMEITKMWLGK